jgi:SAM-dependent methyltransferase
MNPNNYNFCRPCYACRFFRDRNWLFYEFPELESPFGCSVSSEDSQKGILEKRVGESYPGENSGFKVLEIGCGVGNTVFPLLSSNNHPETYVYCCDFSAVAVDIVKNHEKFQPDRLVHRMIYSESFHFLLSPFIF